MYTLPKTNIAPENRLSQKESSIPIIHFEGRTVSFRGGRCTTCNHLALIIWEFPSGDIPWERGIQLSKDPGAAAWTQFIQMDTLPRTNRSPKNQGLEDVFAIELVPF